MGVEKWSLLPHLSLRRPARHGLSCFASFHSLVPAFLDVSRRHFRGMGEIELYIREELWMIPGDGEL